MRLNPPPGWPTPPEGWTPPPGWAPDPSWPEPPPGWQLWLPDVDPPLHPPREEQAHPLGFSQNRVLAAPNEMAGPQDDRAELLARIKELEGALVSAGSAEVVELSDQRALQDAGIYRYHHPLENAAAYKERLVQLESQMDSIIKSGNAVLAADMFTMDGSLARGRRMVSDLSKLMLRAYNAEADNCVRSLRSGNVTTAKKRLDAAVTAIERLGTVMEMRVNPDYHTLRVSELELTGDYQMKVQEEREQAREERELLREQRRAEQELAAERERLEKEKAHYEGALVALRAKGDDVAAAELALRLAEIDEAIERNDYRIANIRAGYVYVISNVGAFGSHIVKIGMTRRLEPLDRVRELGDASVPFPYDVHALFFSDDAITLENELHKAFSDRRVNFVNERREFFFATPSQVREILHEKAGGMLEFKEAPEASQFFQSRSRWPQVVTG